MILSCQHLEEKTGVNYYDGSLIHKRFAYIFLRDKVLPTGNIIAFRSKAEVIGNLVDLEDRMNSDFIYSDDMIHFCWELPCTDLFGGVCFQRLFNAHIGDSFGKMVNKQIDIEGDDIYIAEPIQNAQGIMLPRGKCSVSIATYVNGAVIGHTGVNVNCGPRAPSHAVSTNLTDKQSHELMQEAIGVFYVLTKDIFVATCKVI